MKALLFVMMFIVGCGNYTFTVDDPTPQQPEPQEPEEIEVGDSDDYVPFGAPSTPSAPNNTTDVKHPMPQQYVSAEDFLSSLDLSEEGLRDTPPATIASYENSRSQEGYDRTFISRIRYLETKRFSVFLMRQTFNPTEPDFDSWPLYALVVDRDAPGQTTGSFYGFRASDNPGKLTPVLGEKCDTCHTSGARALRPMNPGQIPASVFKTKYATNDEMVNYINSKVIALGQFKIAKPNRAEGDETPLRMKQCAGCHNEKSSRGPLLRKHGFSIIVAVDANRNDHGYTEPGLGPNAPMPPGRPLTNWQVRCLKDWVGGEDVNCD